VATVLTHIAELADLGVYSSQKILRAMSHQANYSGDSIDMELVRSKRDRSYRCGLNFPDTWKALMRLA